MKATGIVRRIDELGRIVIPKEIRRTMRIRNGDPLEIFTDREGGILLRKYSPMGELNHLGEECCDSLFRATVRTAAVADRDGIIAAAGPEKKLLLEQPLTRELMHIMEERRFFVPAPGGLLPQAVEGSPCPAAGVLPLLCEGEVLGCLLLLGVSPEDYLTEPQKMVLGAMGRFLASQLQS